MMCCLYHCCGVHRPPPAHNHEAADAAVARGIRSAPRDIDSHLTLATHTQTSVHAPAIGIVPAARVTALASIAGLTAARPAKLDSEFAEAVPAAVAEFGASATSAAVPTAADDYFVPAAIPTTKELSSLHPLRLARRPCHNMCSASVQSRSPRHHSRSSREGGRLRRNLCSSSAAARAPPIHTTSAYRNCRRHFRQLLRRANAQTIHLAAAPPALSSHSRWQRFLNNLL
mmetsp:Transcript_37254/g.111540  ORF Transcript_37254/g.111540 Transcript_37254/m.111540 type:complete len:229 (-) Transcript_37254:677-1363(-)